MVFLLLEKDKEQNLISLFAKGVEKSPRHLSFPQSTEQNSLQRHWYDFYFYFLQASSKYSVTICGSVLYFLSLHKK